MDNTIPAVTKAVEVIRLIGNSQGGLTQRELCAALHLTPSTCYRLLQSLLAENWLRKRSGRRYDLADGLLNACRRLTDYAARFDRAQPILDELALVSGFMVKLSVRRDDEYLTLLRAESPRPVAVYSRLGSRFPVVEGSVGAALLADLPDDELLALLDRAPAEVPEKKHPGQLLDRVSEVRRLGYCHNLQGRWQVGTLSVPVRDANREIAGALSVVGNTAEFAQTDLFSLSRQVLVSAINCGKILL